MTTPNFEDIMPRSWVLESSGTSWEWLVVQAGRSSPNNARAFLLPRGVWTITGTWYGNVPAQLRANYGTGSSTTLSVAPAQEGNRGSLLPAVQIGLLESTVVHVRTAGTAEFGSRFALTAIPSPLDSD